MITTTTGPWPMPIGMPCFRDLFGVEELVKLPARRLTIFRLVTLGRFDEEVVG